MPPILLCWRMTLEADGGDMEAEAEPSLQYCCTFLLCDRWQEGGSLTK